MSLFRRAIHAVYILPLLGRFFRTEVGADYGMGIYNKWKLLVKMFLNRSKIQAASGFPEHLFMVTEILRIPRALPGSIVECGTYRGGSAVSFSLVCDLVGRKLDIFDSFSGLPRPSTTDAAHCVAALQEVHTYSEGAWCGSLEEVRGNIGHHGRLDACCFHPGFFADTLPDFNQRCVFVFCDVDLRESLETCLRYLWPLLQDGCCFFTHEAHHMEIASLFFDSGWWGARFQCLAPGLIGGGSGIGLSFLRVGFFGSALGYAVKNVEARGLAIQPQVGL